MALSVSFQVKRDSFVELGLASSVQLTAKKGVPYGPVNISC